MDPSVDQEQRPASGRPSFTSSSSQYENIFLQWLHLLGGRPEASRRSETEIPLRFDRSETGDRRDLRAVLRELQQSTLETARESSFLTSKQHENLDI